VPSHSRPGAETLEPVVISGSDIERRTFETPYAVGVVDAAELRAGGLMVNLSESLVRVPGLTVNNRNNRCAGEIEVRRLALSVGHAGRGASGIEPDAAHAEGRARAASSRVSQCRCVALGALINIPNSESVIARAVCKRRE
jgi:outer membrane receptor protein involved in Fe transport